MSEKFCSIFTFVECKNINRILLTPNSKIPCIHLYSVFIVILPVQLWWIDSYFINYYFFSLTEWVVLKSKRASLNFQSIIHNNQRFFKVSFSYSCPHYSPCCSPLPCPTPPPKGNPYPIVLNYGSFVHVPWLAPSPFYPIIPPSSFPSGHCQFILCFYVSGSSLLICLFCLLGCTYRWDHMVFVFHCLAYFT